MQTFFKAKTVLLKYNVTIQSNKHSNDFTKKRLRKYFNLGMKSILSEHLFPFLLSMSDKDDG